MHRPFFLSRARVFHQSRLLSFAFGPGRASPEYTFVPPPLHRTGVRFVNFVSPPLEGPVFTSRLSSRRLDDLTSRCPPLLGTYSFIILLRHYIAVYNYIFLMLILLTKACPPPSRPTTLFALEKNFSSLAHFSPNDTSYCHRSLPSHSFLPNHDGLFGGMKERLVLPSKTNQKVCVFCLPPSDPPTPSLFLMEGCSLACFPKESEDSAFFLSDSGPFF